MTRTQTNPDLELVVRNWIIMLPPRSWSSLIFFAPARWTCLLQKGKGPSGPPLFVLINSPPSSEA